MSHYQFRRTPLCALPGVYNAAFAGLLLVAQSSGRRLPERIAYSDLVLLGIATYKLSHLISSDRVTRPLRAPFTEYVAPAGASEVKEKVRGTGIQRAIGDLLTCPYCLGPWVATALTFGLVFKPRTTPLIGGILAAATVSEFLNHATTAMKKNEES
ncbi:MAG: DUF1360 domain-containing protein [Acidobacteriota bacterium]|nr:DUF1360 domain-containing protein [Acidobacteriota bacterium]